MRTRVADGGPGASPPSGGRRAHAKLIMESHRSVANVRTPLPRTRQRYPIVGADYQFG